MRELYAVFENHSEDAEWDQLSVWMEEKEKVVEYYNGVKKRNPNKTLYIFKKVNL